MNNLAVIERFDAIKELIQANWYDVEFNNRTRMLKRSLDKYLSQWEKGAYITRLKDYQTLEEEIQRMAESGDKWFYIGHTNKLGNYQWSTKPTDAEAVETITEENLTKKRTYYTRLADHPAENVGALIRPYLHPDADRHPKCLNSNRHGQNLIKGIAFVLVYGRL